MMQWALGFLVVAIIAAVFAFGGIATGIASVAKIAFFLFIALFIISMVINIMRGLKPNT